MCRLFGKVVTFQKSQLKKKDTPILWCLLKQFPNRCLNYHSAVSSSGNLVWVQTVMRSSIKFRVSFLLSWAWFCFLLRLDIQFIIHDENNVMLSLLGFFFHVLVKTLNLFFVSPYYFSKILLFSLVFVLLNSFLIFKCDVLAIALLRIKILPSFLPSFHWDKITSKSWQKHQFLVNF